MSWNLGDSGIGCIPLIPSFQAINVLTLARGLSWLAELRYLAPTDIYDAQICWSLKCIRSSPSHPIPFFRHTHSFIPSRQSNRMKAVTYAALLMGVLTTALGQTLGPSPTESVGCVPHGDHWDCEGPRETTGVTSATGPALTTAPTTTAHHDDDDHDHGHDHTDDEDDHHSGTGSIKPSPTESYGCEAHGDHWHCEGHVTASPTGSAPSTLITTSSTTSLAADAASTSTSVSTAGAPHATGLCVAGLMAVVAMAL
ncbi:hypothetical protein QBC44DRAFT_330992 [Cladorrhinum sp. PSN332]|nr:hypothetical protein QBC44DRAFT_330992 [Cladorrhinum sp. PSN332]